MGLVGRPGAFATFPWKQGRLEGGQVLSLSLPPDRPETLLMGSMSLRSLLNLMLNQF